MFIEVVMQTAAPNRVDDVLEITQEGLQYVYSKKIYIGQITLDNTHQRAEEWL
jgi:hypothetical protein